MYPLPPIFSLTKMYFKTSLPKNSLATCPYYWQLSFLIFLLLLPVPLASAAHWNCALQMSESIWAIQGLCLFSHMCFLYLTHSFSNTFIKHFFFVCPDTENSPGWPDFWSNWKSSIKNALCFSRDSFDPSGAMGLFQAAEGNHKHRKEANVLKHVKLQECCYLSSLRKLHPPFQKEGGLAENSSSVIFQLQKL